MNNNARLAGVDYRWVAMGVVVCGTFMVVLDTTIVNLALASLADDFDSDLSVEWIVTGYLAAVGVAQMTTGWAGDRFGRKRVFTTSLVVFTIGSTLCALSPSLEVLIASRVVQGVGGGLLMPIAMAMIYELFAPNERGRAMGIFGIAVMAAPAIGPVLGGSVISSVGWRWLFLINVPVGLIGIPLAVKLLRDTGYHERRPFDGSGLALAGTGIVSLLIGLQQGGEWGWTSPQVMTLIGLGAALLTGFTLHSLRVTSPLMEMRIFASPVFAIAMTVGALITVAQFCRLVYMPLELGTTRDISTLRIGFVMLPSAIGIAITMPIGGRVTDRIGARVPFVLGASILAATYWPLSNLTPDTGLTTIAGIMFIGGLGAGLAMMTPNIVAMNSVKASQVSQASGLSSVTRQLSAAMGTAILASIFAGNAPDSNDLTGASLVTDAVEAYNSVFLVGFGVLVVTVVVGLFLPGRQKALELQEERRLELEQMSADRDDKPGHSEVVDAV